MSKLEYALHKVYKGLKTTRELNDNYYHMMTNHVSYADILTLAIDQIKQEKFDKEYNKFLTMSKDETKTSEEAKDTK
jgi:hypothetical protein